MSKVTNLWGWVIAMATGLAIVYGLNIPDHINGDSLTGLSMAENILYGGFHRLAWSIAVAWVIFTCCRGYGGKVRTFSEDKKFIYVLLLFVQWWFMRTGIKTQRRMLGWHSPSIIHRYVIFWESMS